MILRKSLIEIYNFVIFARKLRFLQFLFKLFFSFFNRRKCANETYKKTFEVIRFQISAVESLRVYLIINNNVFLLLTNYRT